MDLILRNARPVGVKADTSVDIAIAGDRIARIAPGIEEKPNGRSTRADAWSARLHRAAHPPGQDADRRGHTAQPDGDAPGGIEVIWERKRRYTVEDIVARAGKTIEMAVRNGTTRLRTHADVDTIVGLRPWKGFSKSKGASPTSWTCRLWRFPRRASCAIPARRTCSGKRWRWGPTSSAECRTTKSGWTTGRSTSTSLPHRKGIRRRYRHARGRDGRPPPSGPGGPCG